MIYLTETIQCSTNLGTTTKSDGNSAQRQNLMVMPNKNKSNPDINLFIFCNNK
jgi:hypothetical protein